MNEVPNMKKTKDTLEMRYYDIPKDDFVLALYGDTWTRDYKYIMHVHNVMEFGICRSGTGTMWLEDQQITYGPGMITCIPENYIHTTLSDDENSTNWEYVFLNVDKVLYYFYPEHEFLRSDLEHAIIQKAFCIEPGQNPAIEVFINLLIDEMRNKDIMYKECQKSLCLDLLLQVVRLNQREDLIEKYRIVERRNPEHIRSAITFIHENYTSEVKSADIAAYCHMSESHFRRIFESSTGLTPIEYLNTYRIKRACEMIRTNDVTMKDIAQKSGFSSVSSFNRNFKNIFGLSPVQWKKNADYYKKNLDNYNVLIKKGW